MSVERGSPDNVFPLHAVGKHSLVDTAAEQALLGLLLAKPQFLVELPGCFDPEHYGDAFHADIHRCIVEVGKPGLPALLPVVAALANDDEKRRGYLANLIAAAPNFLGGSARQYADVITEQYRRRCVVALADRMRAGAYEDTKDGTADALVALAMNEIDALHGLAGSVATQGVTSLNEAMDEAMRQADAAVGRVGPVGLATGFASIDTMLGGLEAGTLTVLGGRPGSGKSALGHQIAIHAARQGVGVLEISLEMSAVQLGRRALAAASGVPLWAMKRGEHAQYVKRIIDARRELHDLPLSIEDGGGLTAALITLKARAAQRRHKGLGLIMIDHLHIVLPDAADARHGGTWAVGRVSGAMKRLAKEMGCPVLLLAQLNRQLEARDDKRPGLADLRQAGDIEQDADAVMFAYRPEMYLGGVPEGASGETPEKLANRRTQYEADKVRLRGKAELIFAKVRDGETGTVALTFDGQTTSFAESEQ